MLIHIPNYKLRKNIDKTYRCSNILPRTDKTYSTILKNPEIPVLQHLIIKNDIVFRFFSAKAKIMDLLSANQSILTTPVKNGKCLKRRELIEYYYLVKNVVEQQIVGLTLDKEND